MCLTAVPKSKLEWQKGEGIALYEVQVRNKVTMDVQSYKTSDDHVWVDLLFGFYEMKIIAYDSKGRIISQSDWIALSVMKTYQPEVKSMKMGSPDRTTIVLRGDNYFDQTTVSINSQSAPVQLTIVNGEYPEKLYLNASLEKNAKYSMLVQNPGGYEESRILHVFANDHIMLFRNEYEYSRYFSPLFAEFSASVQLLQNDYWSETFNTGLTQFDLFAGYHFVSWFGLSGGLEYRLYTNKNDAGGEIDLYHHFVIPNVGMFFCYKHKNFIPYIDGSIGYAMSFLSISTEAQDVDFSSGDFFYKYGGGIKIFVWRHLYIDPAFHYSEIILKGKSLPSYDISLGTGWFF